VPDAAGPFERWRLHRLARPLLTLIDWWAPTRRLAARRTATRMLSASPLARTVEVAAAAVTERSKCAALVVVAIAQLV
jgi:hypothetical protein